MKDREALREQAEALYIEVDRLRAKARDLQRKAARLKLRARMIERKAETKEPGSVGRFTADQVRAIRASTAPLRTVARDLGVSHQMVALIRRRELYRDVA